MRRVASSVISSLAIFSLLSVQLRCVSASAKFEVEVDPIGVVRDLGKKESESSSSSSDSEDGVETAEEGVQESESLLL